jgi:hypothetical protein
MQRAIEDAVARAGDRLRDEDCAALFLAPGFNDSNTRRALGERLEGLWNANPNQSRIRLIDSSQLDSGNESIPAFTTGTFGIIYVVANGGFFTGKQNGVVMSNQSPWQGLSMSAIQESVLIHEFMHFMGVVGPDRDPNSRHSLPNGHTVNGSMGISHAVRDSCFR